jgi:membrane protease YdiL (CAAX protease family)
MSLTETTYEKAPNAVKKGWHIAVSPVWNHRESRLRAPLRAVLPLVLTFIGLAAVQPTARAWFDQPLRQVAEFVGFSVVLLGSVLVGSRLIDRRPVAGYGLSVDRGWLRSFAVGGVIATLANAGTFVVALTAGWATVTGFAQGSDHFPIAVVLVFGLIGVAAVWEEFIFRGTMLKNLAEGTVGYAPRWVAVGLAVVLSTAVFALMHGGKVDHFSLYSYYAVAGLVLAMPYVLTGSLAMSMGFHVFYNFTMSVVFGLGVSLKTPELVVLDFSGPGLWVGEEGLLNLIFAAAAGVLVVLYVYRRDGGVGIADGLTNRERTDDGGG